MRYLLAVIGLALAGCGGGDDGPVSCDISDRDGTYLMQFTERSGDCGAAPDTLTRLDANGELGPNCALTQPDDVSADECRLDRSVECFDGDFHTETVGYTEDVSGDGSVLRGTMSVRVEDTFGASCFSTYDVTATRQ